MKLFRFLHSRSLTTQALCLRKLLAVAAIVAVGGLLGASGARAQNAQARDAMFEQMRQQREQMAENFRLQREQAEQRAAEQRARDAERLAESQRSTAAAVQNAVTTFNDTRARLQAEREQREEAAAERDANFRAEQAAMEDRRAARQEAAAQASVGETSTSRPTYTAPRSQAVVQVSAVGKYPQTVTRVISEDEASSMSYAQLRYAINEVYARHGASFPNQADIRKVFQRYGWYHPQNGLSNADIESNFSDVERANIETLANYRNAKK